MKREKNYNTDYINPGNSREAYIGLFFFFCLGFSLYNNCPIFIDDHMKYTSSCSKKGIVGDGFDDFLMFLFFTSVDRG